MKKRTKKKKIIADYRRKMELIKKIAQQNLLLETSPPLQKNSLTEPKIKSVNKKTVNHQFKDISNQKDDQLNLYFKKDLKKTIAISFFIFALEIAIYYAMIKIR